MKTFELLSKRESAVLHAIESYAKQKDSIAVLTSAKELETIVSLKREQERLDSAVRSLARRQWSTEAVPLPTEKAAFVQEELGTGLAKRERGERQRVEFIKNLPPGVTLRRI